MQKLLTTAIAFLIVAFCFGQTYKIEQYLPGTDRVKNIVVGDKVFLSFDQLSDQVLNRPSNVFIQSKDTSLIRIFAKARIANITDSSIQFKDRSVGTNREIRLDKLTGIRKITLGKQIGRTTLQLLGYTLLGIGLASLENLWIALGTVTGGLTLLETSEDHFSKKYVENWKIRLVPVNK